MILINKEGYYYFPADVVSTKDWELKMRSHVTQYEHSIYGYESIVGDYYKIWFNWDDLEMCGNGEFDYDIVDTTGLALSRGVLRIEVTDGEFVPEHSGDYVVYENSMDGYLTTQEGGGSADCQECYDEGYANGYREGERSVKLTSKDLTVTENGTTFIQAPDGYKGLSQVKLSVDVPGPKRTRTDVNFTSNGQYEVRPPQGYDTLDWVNVSVEVPQTGITPTGTKSITQNGEYDITTYEKVNVNVQGSIPTGTVTLTENDHTFYVRDYAWAYVNVPTTQVVSISQEDYDALEVKDNNTIYLIQ